MKKYITLLLLFFMGISIVQANDIPLAIISTTENTHKNEQPGTPVPTFHAELQDGNTVLVFSDIQTSYVVSIYNYNTNQLIYQGTTVNGILHLSTTLPAGIYRIEVTTSNQTYYGSFVIH